MRRSKNGFMIRFYLILTLAISLSVAGLHAQGIGEAYAFAMQQKESGNYALAIKTLNRIQFFAVDKPFPEQNALLAECYFAEKDYASSQRFYALAASQAPDDSSKFEFVSRKISCHLYQNENLDALIELLSFNQQLSEKQAYTKNLLFAITYFRLNDLENAKSYFLKSAAKESPEQSKLITHYFAEVNHINKRYNPHTAKVLSMIIPGSGQWYAGDMRDGINSLVLIGGLFYGGLVLSTTISLIDAGLITLPWLQRYYTGGFNRAYTIAEQKQATEKEKRLIQLVQIVEK